MAVHVAVVDPLPMFQQGVATVLAAAGYAVEEPADVLAWVRRDSRVVVLLTLGGEREWDLLGQLRGKEPAPAVIALLEEGAPVGLGVRAVRAGARSVLWRQVTAGALRRTVDATVDGQAVLPSVVAAALAAGTPTTAGRQSRLSEEQLSWLRRLAVGVTVAQLADDVGYSERAMYRLLHAVYQEMGVRTRVQAIMQAQDSGWLRPETGGPTAGPPGRG
ncbi:helix-turn-helix transcriptional regulator [Micromonospora kangleipakensis]|uniref:helix-turn-helix transcriptional regulator n=1 Tax=Micromonospora kangleipakensis TaxID=1077942 RepID=UPI001A919D17|nr:response regulator transcription factor [Micromonospora kangleipakensis]